MKLNISILALMFSLTSINIHAADLEHENIARFGYSSFIPNTDALYELCSEVKCCLMGVYEAPGHIGRFIAENKKIVAPLCLMVGYAAIAAINKDPGIEENELSFYGDCGGGRKELGQSIANKIINNEALDIKDIKNLKPRIDFYAYYYHDEHYQFRTYKYDSQDLTTCLLTANPARYYGEPTTNFGKLAAFYLREHLQIKRVCYLNGEVDECYKTLGDPTDFKKLTRGVSQGEMSVSVSTTKDKQRKNCRVIKNKR